MKEKKMRKARRTFKEEFKEEAVELAKKEGNTKVAIELGISESCIRYWRNKQESPPVLHEKAKNKKKYDELERENLRLAKELGLNACLKKKFRVQTTDSNHSHPIAPMIFKVEEENSLPKRPGEILAGDIT